ncbi:MAG: hypothetical protein Kow0098_10080 [Ignavibacteriaceae bacterium]
MKKILMVIFILLPEVYFAQNDFTEEKSIFAHTYSIVARDTLTGEMGVAVQSHWFSVGTIVTWGEAGVGVVATQSFVNPAFGPDGLALLKQGFSAKQVLDSLIAGDEGRDFRQVAILDVNGNVAAYTGSNCIEAAGHLIGENFSVQANLMLNSEVWPAMYNAFKNSTGPLAERLLAALEAAENAGGDIRGKQSAAILVVRGDATGKLWQDRVVDIRIDDSPEPLIELKRLLKVHRAYEHMNNGDLAVEKGDMELALKEYSAAEELFPDNLEMKYWHAVALANNNRLKEALPIFREVFLSDENWRILTPRLIKNGLLMVSEVELNEIMELR